MATIIRGGQKRLGHSDGHRQSQGPETSQFHGKNYVTPTLWKVRLRLFGL